MYVLTSKQQAGERNDIELFDSHIIVVHEQVQQVDGQMACRRTELVAIAQDGQQVCKVSPHADLRGVGSVDRQLQLLNEERTAEYK